MMMLVLLLHLYDLVAHCVDDVEQLADVTGVNDGIVVAGVGGGGCCG